MVMKTVCIMHNIYLIGGCTLYPKHFCSYTVFIQVYWKSAFD